MKTLKLVVGSAVVSLLAVQFASANPSGGQGTKDEVPQRYDKASSYHEPLAPAIAGNEEILVFLTGSHIPQRLRVKAIGTKTASPLRIYTREEIDRMGRFTTPRIVAQDPAINIVGGR